MSNTPRTDAELSRIANTYVGSAQDALLIRHARELETELAEARQQLVERDALVERMRESLNELIACRQLKKDAARVAQAKQTANSMAHIDRLYTAYGQRDPIAWETAVNVLTLTPSTALEAHDAEVRRKVLEEAAQDKGST